MECFSRPCESRKQFKRTTTLMNYANHAACRDRRAGVHIVKHGELCLRYEHQRLVIAWGAHGAVCLMTRDAFQNIVLNVTPYGSNLSESRHMLARILKNEMREQGLYIVRITVKIHRVRNAELLNTKDKRWLPGQLFRIPKGR